jgi:hypothetical protein
MILNLSVFLTISAVLAESFHSWIQTMDASNPTSSLILFKYILTPALQIPADINWNTLQLH